MTTTNAPDVGINIDALIGSVAVDGCMSGPAADTIRAHLSRLEEQLAQARGGLADAYDAGFMASGEGWNGEHGGDTDSRHYLKRRAEYFAALATQTGATHES